LAGRGTELGIGGELTTLATGFFTGGVEVLGGGTALGMGVGALLVAGVVDAGLLVASEELGAA
jgi:hypothetical protein